MGKSSISQGKKPQRSFFKVLKSSLLCLVQTKVSIETFFSSHLGFKFSTVRWKQATAKRIEEVLSISNIFGKHYCNGKRDDQW